MVHNTSEAEISALVAAVEALPQDLFSAYRGGWKGQIGLALVDAVHSIQARYYSDHPGCGVWNRVAAFRDAHPEAVDDLEKLSELDAAAIEAVMGRGKTAEKPKSRAVLEAARAFCALPSPIVRTTDFTVDRRDDARNAYRSVRGLGKVTFDYFAMNLGHAGVKPDTLVTRFVARHAYGDPGRALSPAHVTDLVTEAYGISPRGAETLTHFEHALWKAESDGVADQVSAAR